MKPLRHRIPEEASEAALRARGATVWLRELNGATALSRPLGELEGRSILVATSGQLGAAIALLELDGVARRLVIAAPDVAAEYLPMVFEMAGIEAVVCDTDSAAASLASVAQGLPIVRVAADGRLAPAADDRVAACETEWVLMTSGTTGAPKLVVHTIETLTAVVPELPQPDVVWATFYDMRRYGGLQIFLRAVCGGGSFVMSDADEAPADFLARLAANGATHVSGTPSHWRRALMSPAAGAIAPRYVRMSGEIADQTIINSLRAKYPDAGVSHAFATTEAGVGFPVDDGLAGFPASYVGRVGAVDVQVADGSLRLRSTGTALRYLGSSNAAIRDGDGFVDTGDAVELRGGRYHFLGRRSGLINIGGLKVYPEEIETVINRHPAVRMSLARAKRSPITGALVMADVVLKSPDETSAALLDLKNEILALCRETLSPHKVPATIRFVADLNVAAAGKLARANG